MIFETNKKAELLIEAAEFRLSYSRLKESRDIYRKRAQGYIINLDFFNYQFYSPRLNEFFTISSFNDSIKQNIFSIYYFNTILSEYKKAFDILVDKLKTFNYKTELDIKYLNSVIKKQRIKTTNNISKVFLLDNFKDSNTENSYHLKDFKTNVSLSKNNIIDSSNETLNINKIQSINIIPEFVDVIKEETSFGDSKEPLIYNDIENILEEKDPFRFIVCKKIEDILGYTYVVEKSYLTVLFDFNKITKINNIKVNYSSSKQITIEKDDIRFFNTKTKSWESIEFVDLLNNNNSDFYFETITTNKIKITFTQYQHLEEKQIENFTAKIYDLSIDCVLFNFSTYKNMSLFRSNDYLSLNQPMSFTYDVDYLFKDNDVFAERYFYLTLYGEESFDSFKKRTLLKDDINRETVRYKKVIPVPENSLVQKELLVFNLGAAKMLFVPNELTIKVYKNDSLVPLVYGVDYVISRDSKNSYLSEDELQQFVTLEKRFSGNWYVKLLSNNPDLRHQFLNSYRVEYETLPMYFLDKDIICLNNKIVLGHGLQNSVGFVKPYLILRSKKNKNDSSSIIKQLLIKCEEKEEDKSSDIELEDFIELIAEGS